MRLTAEEETILAGRAGEAARCALEQQIQVGAFFGAEDFVPVGSVHLAGDAAAMREAAVAYLEEIVALGAACRVPTTTNPRSVDFAHATALGQEAQYVEWERRLVHA